MTSLKHQHVLLVRGWSGCAPSYKCAADARAATTDVAGNTCNFYTEAYENGNCEPSRSGTRLATLFGPKRDAGSAAIRETVQVPNGRPPVLTDRYIDARASQNSACNVGVFIAPERAEIPGLLLRGFGSQRVRCLDLWVGHQASRIRRLVRVQRKPFLDWCQQRGRECSTSLQSITSC
jgi:hypothetical protein